MRNRITGFFLVLIALMGVAFLATLQGCTAGGCLGEDVASLTGALATGDAAAAAETFTGVAEGVAEVIEEADTLLDGDPKDIALGLSGLLNAGLIYWINRKKKTA